MLTVMGSCENWGKQADSSNSTVPTKLTITCNDQADKGKFHEIIEFTIKLNTKTNALSSYAPSRSREPPKSTQTQPCDPSQLTVVKSYIINHINIKNSCVRSWCRGNCLIVLQLIVECNSHRICNQCKTSIPTRKSVSPFQL